MLELPLGWVASRRGGIDGWPYLLVAGEGLEDKHEGIGELTGEIGGLRGHGNGRFIFRFRRIWRGKARLRLDWRGEVRDCFLDAGGGLGVK